MERIRLDLPKDWLSVADICEYMDVSAFVVTRMIRGGDLPAVKFGREWRISTQDFENYLNLQRGLSGSDLSRDESEVDAKGDIVDARLES